MIHYRNPYSIRRVWYNWWFKYKVVYEEDCILYICSFKSDAEAIMELLSTGHRVGYFDALGKNDYIQKR